MKTFHAREHVSGWSSYVFPERPSTGFSAALFVFGVGLIGPATLDALAGSFGLQAAFLATTTLLIMLVRPEDGQQTDNR